MPADAKTREAFEWLAEEIEEQGGTALLWQATSLTPEQDQAMVQRFRAEADARYTAISTSAQGIRKALMGSRKRVVPERRAHAIRQLHGLERALRLERRRDYFQAPARSAAAAIVAAALSDVEGQALPPMKAGGLSAVGH